MRLRSWGALGAFAVLGGTAALAVSASGAPDDSATQDVHRPDARELRSSPTRAASAGSRGHEAGQGQKIDPKLGGGAEVRRLPRRRHDAALAKVGGAAEALRLPLHVQRLRRGADRRRRPRSSRSVPGVVAVDEGRAGRRRHVVDAGLPRPRRDRAASGTSSAGRRSKAAAPARTSSSASSTPASGRRARASPTAPDERQRASSSTSRSRGWHGKCTPGRGVQRRRNCNQKLIGAQLLQRRLGAATPASRPSARGSSSRRATTTATARTPPRPPAATTASPPTGRGGGVRHDQRHGAARAHRRLQGLLVDPGRVDGERLQLRPRRRHRPGRRRRRRRDQLLDQRHDDELPRPGRDRVPVRRRRGRLRRRVGRQQRPGDAARSRTRARGSPRSPPARTTATATARSRSATARPTPAPRWPPRSARRRSSTRRPPASPAPTPTALALCFAASTTAATRSSTRRRSPARSWSATAASTPASTRAWRCSRRAASG